MKTPSLLLLLAVVASPASAADPAPAAGAAHRCQADVLKDAGAAAARLAPATALSLSSDTLTDGRKDTKEMTFCEGTVWHYLGHLAPVPGGQPAVIWNDPDLQKDWAAGLPEQLKILTAIDNLYKSHVDDLGLEALAAADAVVNDAVTTGVVAKIDGKPGMDLSKLMLSGFTGNAFAMKTNYTLSAPAAAAADAPSATDDMKAAFKRLLADVPARPAPKGAPAAKGPKEVKAGSAVLAFRKSIIMLANDLALSASSRQFMQAAGVNATVTRDFSLSAAAAPGAKAVLVGAGGITTIPQGIEAKESAYKAALAFLVGTDKIAAVDDDAAHESAALSGLDYGLRNLIALRAAAVDQSVAAAKARLNGASVAEMVGPARKAGPAAKAPPATMADDVMKRLAATQDYADLNKLYENGGPKNPTTGAVDPNWKTSAEGVAVQAQLAAMQKDAAAVTTVKNGQPNAGMLQYSIGGHAVTDQGISVADFKLSPSYRDTIMDAIASNIAAYPMTAQAQAALAAFRGVGQPGAPLVPLTPDQKKAASLLPPAAPVVVTAPKPETPPAGTWDTFEATHQGGCAFAIWGCRSATGQATQDNEDQLAEQAHNQIVQRATVERAAENAATQEAQVRDAGLQAIESDTNPEIDKDAAVKAYKAETDKRAAAARAAYLTAHSGDYVKDDDAKKALDVKRQAFNDQVDAAYSDGIAQAVGNLNELYKAPSSDQRSYAESKSGYKGQWYDKYPIQAGRVDAYFADNWKAPTESWGDVKPKAAIAKCKASLGFKKDGDLADYKDPTIDNVDKFCGVRDGLVAKLASYKGKQEPAAPPVVKVAVPITVPPGFVLDANNQLQPAPK